MNPLNRQERLVADQLMIDGVQKHLAQLPAVPVHGQMMTPADIVKFFQTRIDAGKAAIQADAARAAAVKGDKDQLATTTPTAASFRRMIMGMFAQSPDILAAFGLKPRKVATTTVEQKKAAVAKSLATRKARGTLGPKQKAKIHGTVETPALPKAQ